MLSRPRLDADRIIGPEVHRRTAVAFEEATQRHDIKNCMSTVHCHITRNKDINLVRDYTVWHVRAVR